MVELIGCWRRVRSKKEECVRVPVLWPPDHDVSAYAATVVAVFQYVLVVSLEHVSIASFEDAAAYNTLPISNYVLE